MDQEKIDAVREYLRSQFQGCAIEDLFDEGRMSQTFTITCGKSIFIARIQKEFLDNRGSSDISGLLRTFLLAEHLRDLENTPVIITNSGLSLE